MYSLSKCPLPPESLIPAVLWVCAIKWLCQIFTRFARHTQFLRSSFSTQIFIENFIENFYVCTTVLPQWCNSYTGFDFEIYFTVDLELESHKSFCFQRKFTGLPCSPPAGLLFVSVPHRHSSMFSSRIKWHCCLLFCLWSPTQNRGVFWSFSWLYWLDMMQQKSGRIKVPAETVQKTNKNSGKMLYYICKRDVIALFITCHLSNSCYHDNNQWHVHQQTGNDSYMSLYVAIERDTRSVLEIIHSPLHVIVKN